ncbi:T9SS type A sorting domain-containing protein [Pelobium manganitolerans]|uniref:T9SS type A sorting domain-containing protein n=1 Tax=Pelobium manganitolerans TaxID=1842495 RepID=UPI003FA36562
MKKSLLSLFGVTVGVLSVFSTAMAQTPASATWALSADKTVVTSGSISANDQGLGGLSDATYSTAIGYYEGGWQRLTSTSTYTATTTATPPVTSPSLPFITGPLPDYTHYAEFKITSNATLYTKINTFKLTAFGGGTGNARLVVLYSLDNFATPGSPMPSAGAYNSTTYPATEATPVTLINTGDAGKPANVPPVAATKTLEQATLTFSNINQIIAPNTTFSVRVYPFLSSASTTSARYFVSQNASIGATTATSISLLPLNFLSFTAKPDAFGKTVALNWSTTNEVNTASFAIQKRTDNGDFATIGNIPSKNTAGVHHYSFADNNASAGNSYYRIVQYDNDHSSSNSEVQAVSIKASAGGVNIYPNPVADVLNANHSALQAGATAKISNSNGSTVLQQALTVGATQSSIDVSQLKPGVYILSISGQAAQKFVKR